MEKHPEEIHIKNVLHVDVDGLKGINTYTIKEMYDARQEDARGIHYVIKHRLIDKFTMTWDEIERDGGMAQVNKDLKECYNLSD